MMAEGPARGRQESLRLSAPTRAPGLPPPVTRRWAREAAGTPSPSCSPAGPLLPEQCPQKPHLTRSSGRGLAEPCKVRRPPSRSQLPRNHSQGFMGSPGGEPAQSPSWAGPVSVGSPARRSCLWASQGGRAPIPHQGPSLSPEGRVTCQSAVSLALGPEFVQGGCVGCAEVASLPRSEVTSPPHGGD